MTDRTAMSKSAGKNLSCDVAIFLTPFRVALHYTNTEEIDMEQGSQNGNQETVPVYLSFKTFQAAVQSLRTHGLPDSLDRTAFGSRSGAEQTQILSALRFLGLLSDANKTQESLKALVKATEGGTEEKSILAALLKQRYANAFALNLESATPAQLDKAIGDYGATGATRDRSVRFFIKACEYCSIKLSSRLTARKARAGSTSTSNGTGDEPPAQQSSERTGRRRRRGIDAPAAPSSNFKTVSLPNVAGNLTVSGTFNYFELEGDERELVNGIIDLLKKFEKAHEDEDEA